MRALSLWQPWAHLCIYGTPDGRRKLWETRQWRRLPRRLVGERLALHAAKRRDKGIERLCRQFGLDPDALAWGAMVGVVEVTAVKRLSMLDEPEALCECAGAVGIGISNPLALDPPLLYRGRQGFWTIPDDGLAPLRVPSRVVRRVDNVRLADELPFAEPVCDVCGGVVVGEGFEADSEGNIRCNRCRGH